jgi:hypothetical protein
MSYRRQGKKAHDDDREWDAWKREHAELLKRCAIPPGPLRSREDWQYLLRYGYWREHSYGKFSHRWGDFSLHELARDQREAFRELLTSTLTDAEKARGSAGWHLVCPPAK